MEHYTDSLIEEYIEDSNSLVFAPNVTVEKLKRTLSSNYQYTSYAAYMEFVKKYSVNEIEAAKVAENDFINTAVTINNDVTIIKATKTGFIVDITYNTTKHVALSLRDYMFVNKYAPVAYENYKDPTNSVEYFVFHYSAVVGTELFKAIRFNETNISLRYATQKHGPKRVGTFYKTYSFEKWCIANSEFGLQKYSPEQAYLKKGPGDSKPDFKYTLNGKEYYAEAKMGMSIKEALKACNDVNMMPFPNKILILNKDNTTLEVYDIDENKKVIETAIYNDVVDIPEIPDLPETW